MATSNQLAPKNHQPDLPAILAGAQTPAIGRRGEDFFASVASIFETWVSRRQSPHTQRAYQLSACNWLKTHVLSPAALATVFSLADPS